MKTLKLLFIIVVATSYSNYAQENNCDNYKTLTSEGLLKGVDKVHTEKLKESFTVFENLLKTKETELFLKKIDDYFMAFDNPKEALVPILNQISIKNICIYNIEVDADNISSIFFNDAKKPDDKMVLKISETFKYLSWGEVKPIIKGSIHLEGDIVKVPFITIGEWPFIDGEINGIKGRWMFDTGNARSISLHSKKVVGAIADTIGSGFVGSGQSFKTLEYPLIDEIKVGGLVFESVPHIDANDMNYLEPITTNVIGQVGFDFFKGYDMKMDYLRGELTFYKQKKEESWKGVKNTKNYITTLKYFTRKLYNIPMIKINHKGIEFLASFDTGGGKGQFELGESNFKKLKKDGDIEDFYDEPSPLYNFYNIKLNEDLKNLNLYGLYKQELNPAREPLGITEENYLALDYYFFSRYITVWDTKNKEIHIFENK